MPLVCTKNVTFLFFQSSTYNMLKIASFVYFSVIFSWARHRLHGPVADFMGPSLHFQRPRPIFMVTGPQKNDGKLFEHVIGGTLEK